MNEWEIESKRKREIQRKKKYLLFYKYIFNLKFAFLVWFNIIKLEKNFLNKIILCQNLYLR